MNRTTESKLSSLQLAVVMRLRAAGHSFVASAAAEAWAETKQAHLDSRVKVQAELRRMFTLANEEAQNSRLPEVSDELILTTSRVSADLSANGGSLNVERLKELARDFPVITAQQLRYVQRVFEANPNGANWHRVNFYMYVWQQQVYR